MIKVRYRGKIKILEIWYPTLFYRSMIVIHYFKVLKKNVSLHTKNDSSGDQFGLKISPDTNSVIIIVYMQKLI